MMTSLWITWEDHRRSRELARSLDGMKYVVHELDAFFLLRYPVLLFKTWRSLERERPALVCVQNPSVVLTAFMCTVGKALGCVIVVDAHNAGLAPHRRALSFLRPLYRFLQKRADITIVTNPSLAADVRRSGGRPFVLPDKIPSLPDVVRTNLPGRFNIAFICTFAEDEPYLEVIQSAALLPGNVVIHITGNYQKGGESLLRNKPGNVIFTGFLPELDYVALLASCDAIIDLTMRDDCLVCGAYEGVALGKPLILSDTTASRHYFTKGVIYTLNHHVAVTRSILECLSRRDQLRDEIVEFRSELANAWETSKRRLQRLINAYSTDRVKFREDV
ncbi:MAG: hypothetical protein IMF18_11865 [Proteobacteria bacterium]|nr:hypothetical protein [Pseudomonadota bacterium]